MDPYRRMAFERHTSHSRSSRPSTSQPRSERGPASGLFVSEYDPFNRSSSSSRHRPSMTRMDVDPSDSSRYSSTAASYIGGPPTRHLSSSRAPFSYTGNHHTSRRDDVADLYPPMTRRSAIGGHTAGDFSGADPDSFYAELARRASRQRTSDGDPELPTYRSPSDYMRSSSLHRAPSYGDPQTRYSSDTQPPPYSSYSGPSAGYRGDRYPPTRRPSYWEENSADTLMDRDHFRRSRR